MCLQVSLKDTSLCLHVSSSYAKFLCNHCYSWIAVPALLFLLFILFYFILFYFILLLCRDVPAAYGGSQARSPIRATAANQRHSHSGIRAKSETYTTAHGNARSSTKLNEARDRTLNFMVPSQIHFRCAMGTPPFSFSFFPPSFLLSPPGVKNPPEVIHPSPREGELFLLPST